MIGGLISLSMCRILAALCVVDVRILRIYYIVSMQKLQTPELLCYLHPSEKLEANL